MEPMSMFMLGSSVLSGIGQLFGGSAAKEQAELNAYGARIDAYNIDTERELAQAQAMQRHNDRLDEYRTNLSANIATFTSQGRDTGSDRSIAAFLERQKQTAAEDVSRSDFMGEMQKGQLASQAMGARAEAYAMQSQGRAQQQSAVIGAFTTIAGGLYRYDQVRTGGSSGSPTMQSVSGPMKSTSVRPRARPF